MKTTFSVLAIIAASSVVQAFPRSIPRNEISGGRDFLGQPLVVYKTSTPTIAKVAPGLMRRHALHGYSTRALLGSTKEADSATLRGDLSFTVDTSKFPVSPRHDSVEHIGVPDVLDEASVDASLSPRHDSVEHIGVPDVLDEASVDASLSPRHDSVEHIGVPDVTFEASVDESLSARDLALERIGAAHGASDAAISTIPTVPHTPFTPAVVGPAIAARKVNSPPFTGQIDTVVDDAVISARKESSPPSTGSVDAVASPLRFSGAPFIPTVFNDVNTRRQERRSRTDSEGTFTASVNALAAPPLPESAKSFGSAPVAKTDFTGTLRSAKMKSRQAVAERSATRQEAAPSVGQTSGSESPEQAPPTTFSVSSIGVGACAGVEGPCASAGKL